MHSYERPRVGRFLLFGTANGEREIPIKSSPILNHAEKQKGKEGNLKLFGI